MAAKAPPKLQLVIELPEMTPKTGSIRFDADEVDPLRRQLRTLYLGKEGYKLLGNPRGIRVTIEPLER